MLKKRLFLFVTLCLSGCASPKNILVADALDKIPVVTGSVVNAAAFMKGGTLVLDSFRPGTGAAADDETDQISSMVIKGIKDTLPSQNSHFALQTDAQKDPDCLLDGFIEDYGTKGKDAHLSLDGEIWLKETGEKIFLFQTAVLIDLKSQNPKTAAYQMGVAIAHFIGSNS